MKFRKINDNTVNCILSEEDMEARGVTLEDFFTDIARIIKNGTTSTYYPRDFYHNILNKL